MSSESAAPELVAVPAEGVPPVVDTPAALAAATQALAAASGPVAVDTERAQGCRYSAKAYLIQLRRVGGGTHLLDPVALETDADRADLSGLADALGDAEWIVHAATQDLPCLAEVGLVPRRLFDTELGGRLLGLPRVSLGALTEVALGKTLLKEHSASDWSRRPLPAPGPRCRSWTRRPRCSRRRPPCGRRPAALEATPPAVPPRRSRTRRSSASPGRSAGP